MWVTLIATAMAASVCACVVNLASEISKIRDARYSPGVEITVARKPGGQIPETPTIGVQKTQKGGYFGPGA